MSCRTNFQKSTDQVFKNMLYIRNTINLSQKNLTGYPPGRYCHIHDPGMLNGIKVPTKRTKIVSFFIISQWTDRNPWKWSISKDI